MHKELSQHCVVVVKPGQLVRTITPEGTDPKEVKQLQLLAFQLQAPKELNTFPEVFTDAEIHPN